MDDEWLSFMNGNELSDEVSLNIPSQDNIIPPCPIASDIYISTRSMITYLTVSEINLFEVFWKIPIIPYISTINGVIKKQIKINSSTKEEVEDITKRLSNEKLYNNQIITSIDNPDGRIKFKDIRKISIGLCKKDIISYHPKKKSAFYNCFVLIVRIKLDNIFNEYHVKVFNTGKIEIPGIQHTFEFTAIMDYIVKVLSQFISIDSNTQLSYNLQNVSTILINSNFNCGYYINRNELYVILKTKYNIQCIYDPCSYPGIQCKFYYNNTDTIHDGISNTNKTSSISFMIFRTGNVLIVGKCEDDIIYSVYNFLKKLLKDEYLNIYQPSPIQIAQKNPKTKKKRFYLQIK